MEADLLGANTEQPATDGTEMPATDGTEAPVDGTEPATDGTEMPAGDEEDEDPVKAIQKLTGKLTQKLRDANENLEAEDIKYTLNSIISATDINKLSDEDKTDIMNKIEDKDEEGGETTAAPAEEPMAENEDMMGDEPKFYENLLNDKTVNHIIDMADLSYELRQNPETIAFDFCEAAYIFTHDYNDNTEFINKLKSLLRDNQFKARPSLNSKDDLEYFGDMIYDALVKHTNEHNAEVLEYSALNERVLSILEKARQNVKNNINK